MIRRSSQQRQGDGVSRKKLSHSRQKRCNASAVLSAVPENRRCCLRVPAQKRPQARASRHWSARHWCCAAVLGTPYRPVAAEFTVDGNLQEHPVRSTKIKKSQAKPVCCRTRFHVTLAGSSRSSGQGFYDRAPLNVHAGRPCDDPRPAHEVRNIAASRPTWHTIDGRQWILIFFGLGLGSLRCVRVCRGQVGTCR